MFNMMVSASGTIENPGTNVAQKKGRIQRTTEKNFSAIAQFGTEGWDRPDELAASPRLTGGNKTNARLVGTSYELREWHARPANGRILCRVSYLRDEALAKALGTVFKTGRLEAALSQAALAERCGLKRAALAAVERGEKAITIETAHRIGTALGMPLSEVFRRLEEATTI